jgi:Transposase
MRFAGIDIGSERHVVALVDETGAALEKPVSFGEEAAVYRRLRELLGDPADCLVAMEATGHYWRNLFAFLVAEGFTIALVNPLCTRRFAEEELERTKTDAIDAQGIARFAAQKRPTPTQLPEATVEELRELVRLREQTVQQLAIECGICTMRSIWVFRSSRASCAAWIPGLPPRSSHGTRRPKPCAEFQSGSSPSCATTVGVTSETISRAHSSGQPRSRSASITVSLIGCRSSMPVRT